MEILLPCSCLLACALTPWTPSALDFIFALSCCQCTFAAQCLGRTAVLNHFSRICGSKSLGRSRKSLAQGRIHPLESRSHSRPSIPWIDLQVISRTARQVSLNSRPVALHLYPGRRRHPNHAKTKTTGCSRLYWPAEHTARKWCRGFDHFAPCRSSRLHYLVRPLKSLCCHSVHPHSIFCRDDCWPHGFYHKHCTMLQWPGYSCCLESSDAWSHQC